MKQVRIDNSTSYSRLQSKLGFAGSVLTCILATSLSRAEPRDQAAERKVAEAMTVINAAGDYNRAEAVLLGTDRACADQCSARVKAQIWLYIGSVRGSCSMIPSCAVAAF